MSVKKKRTIGPCRGVTWLYYVVFLWSRDFFPPLYLDPRFRPLLLKYVFNRKSARHSQAKKCKFYVCWNGRTFPRLFDQQLAGGAHSFRDFQREHQCVREILVNTPGSIDVESLAKDFSYPSFWVANSS